MVDTQIIMKVIQSGSQTARRLIILRVRQQFYFGRTRTPALGVLVKFSGV